MSQRQEQKVRRKCSNHSTRFKTKVAVTALKGDRTQAESAEDFDIHPNQIMEWRKQLLEIADQVFGRSEKNAEESECKIKEFHAKIGQLTMKRDFLEHGLERIHGPKRKG